MRPSARTEMLPSSTVGTRSASRPIGLRVVRSEVIRPLVWNSMADAHPPIEEETVVIAIGLMVVTPKTSDFVRAGRAAWAGAASPDRGAAGEGAAQAITVMRHSAASVRGLKPLAE